MPGNGNKKHRQNKEAKKIVKQYRTYVQNSRKHGFQICCEALFKNRGSIVRIPGVGCHLPSRHVIVRFRCYVLRLIAVTHHLCSKTGTIFIRRITCLVGALFTRFEYVHVFLGENGAGIRGPIFSYCPQPWRYVCHGRSKQPDGLVSWCNQDLINEHDSIYYWHKNSMSSHNTGTTRWGGAHGIPWIPY